MKNKYKKNGKTIGNCEKYVGKHKIHKFLEVSFEIRMKSRNIQRWKTKFSSWSVTWSDCEMTRNTCCIWNNSYLIKQTAKNIWNFTYKLDCNNNNNNRKKIWKIENFSPFVVFPQWKWVLFYIISINMHHIQHKNHTSSYAAMYMRGF